MNKGFLAYQGLLQRPRAVAGPTQISRKRSIGFVDLVKGENR